MCFSLRNWTHGTLGLPAGAELQFFHSGLWQIQGQSCPSQRTTWIIISLLKETASKDIHKMGHIVVIMSITTTCVLLKTIKMPTVSSKCGVLSMQLYLLVCSSSINHIIAISIIESSSHMCAYGGMGFYCFELSSFPSTQTLAFHPLYWSITINSKHMGPVERNSTPNNKVIVPMPSNLAFHPLFLFYEVLIRTPKHGGKLKHRVGQSN